METWLSSASNSFPVIFKCTVCLGKKKKTYKETVFHLTCLHGHFKATGKYLSNLPMCTKASLESEIQATIATHHTSTQLSGLIKGKPDTICLADTLLGCMV